MWWKFMKCCLALQAVAFLFASSAAATLDPIVIKGSHFFYKTNGTEFFIRGVAYQQSVSGSDSLFIDPLADSSSCERDVPYLQELNTNVVHVYAINSTQDHSACMDLLDSAGIYVLIDLTNPSSAIVGGDPTWNLELYTTYTSVIDSMQNFTNVLGFLAGNEVSSNISTSTSAAYVKAAVRDMKGYIETKNYRSIGVGYATDDDPGIFALEQDYYNCGDSNSSIDFLGLNIYSWCGDSSYTASGYSDLTDSFSNYSIPVFLSEYGCNTQGGGAAGRNFTEVSALYGPQMSEVFSGGIVYEYFEEENDYGLVSVSGNSVSTLADFGSLSTQLASASPSSTASSAYIPSNTVARSCPTTGFAWLASETLPPAPDSTLCDCMMSSLSCVTGSRFSESNAGTIFSQVCGENAAACSGIASNATTGIYGAYSMCNITAQVSWAMNQYYLSQNKASTSCDFSGSAKVQSPGSAGTQCQTLLAQAGSDGTGTTTSLSSGTGTSSSKSSSATGNSGSSGSGSTGSQNSNGSGSSGGGLSTGAKAGIAIGAVLIIAILAGILFLLWRRKRKPKDPPLSGEGGLEVGDAPPQFTALRRAEMEANEAKQHHVITGEPPESKLATHDIHVEDNAPNNVNELDSNRERQELDSSGVPTQTIRGSELDDTARRGELSGISSRGELSGNSTSRSKLSPRRKPVSGPASPSMRDQTSQPITSASWTNNPWTDPGVAGLGVASPVTNKTAAEAVEEAELRRLEEEERRIDEAIAESERLQALRREKEELQKRKLEFRARASAGGGGSNSSAAPL